LNRSLLVILDAKKARDVYVDVARSIENDGLLLFPNSLALLRAGKLGIVDYLRAYHKNASIKIICPIAEENSPIIKKILIRHHQ
jgi:hypothetical protein